MCEPCTPEALLEAVRGLRVADPDLDFKPLLAKLRAQQPDRLGSGHQGGPRGAGGAKGRERGCRGRHRRATRCRRGRRALFERGAEPRLHRLPQAAVSHGRRAREAPHL
eukprot:scaffold36968_cov62-Phaeocystis_antarctica.AAC.2